MFKVHNKNTRKTSMDVNFVTFMIKLDQNLIKIYQTNKYMLKSAIKTLEKGVNLEHISDLFLSILLILRK